MKKLIPILLLLLCAALLLASCKKDPPVVTTTAATTTAREAATVTQPETTEETTMEETEPIVTAPAVATEEPATGDMPRVEQASPAEIRAEERRALNLLSSLDTDKIEKIVLEQTRPTVGGAQRFTYESESKEAIEAWAAVFGAMELSGEQFEFLSGGNLAVYAYIGGERVELGCIEGSYLTNGRLKTMCKIDNYDALYGDIQSAAALVNGDILV
ncbi:MAG: hypothetical protein FWE98_02795 [Oscillospiraceae bacterium]|nr:hypothetical protein [Oscillospiraceae bacterium]